MNPGLKALLLMVFIASEKQHLCIDSTTMVFTGFQGPAGREKMRETCSFHPASITCHISSVVKSYDQKNSSITYVGFSIDFIARFYCICPLEGYRALIRKALQNLANNIQPYVST